VISVRDRLRPVAVETEASVAVIAAETAVGIVVPDVLVGGECRERRFAP
jgi:hypothetical protein